MVQLVLDVAPQHHGFSKHLQSNTRLFFANLEDSLWLANGRQCQPTDAEGQDTIIEAFCVCEQTYPNGYYYENLEQGQQRTVRDISCFDSPTEDRSLREFNFEEVPIIWD